MKLILDIVMIYKYLSTKISESGIDVKLNRLVDEYRPVEESSPI
ncbi:MAG: hypothetical protein ACT6FF_09010 [Methanosarcinaceae archaeon]